MSLPLPWNGKCHLFTCIGQVLNIVVGLSVPHLFLLSVQSHLTKPWPPVAELFSVCSRDTRSCWLTSDWDSSLCGQILNSFLEYLVRKIPDLTAIVYMSLSLRSIITPIMLRGSPLPLKVCTWNILQTGHFHCPIFVSTTDTEKLSYWWSRFRQMWLHRQ